MFRFVVHPDFSVDLDFLLCEGKNLSRRQCPSHGAAAGLSLPPLGKALHLLPTVNLLVKKSFGALPGHYQNLQKCRGPSPFHNNLCCLNQGKNQKYTEMSKRYSPSLL